tara:strand:- start:10856 stop:12070 length:1215 start_codon:yes stop_codon:yes gene_type:complete
LKKEKALDANSKSIEDLIQLVKKHDTRTSKYAKKRARKVNVDQHTTVVTLPEAIERLTLGGKIAVPVKGRQEARPVVSLDASQMYHPGSFVEGEVNIVKHDWTTVITAIDKPITDFNVKGLFGRYPRLAYRKDARGTVKSEPVVELDGIISNPMVGMNPVEGETVKTRADYKLLSAINRRLMNGRVRTVIAAPAIDGALPCWQTRATFGEAEPFIEGSDQCVTCANTVQGFNTEYCADAYKKSHKRRLNTFRIMQEIENRALHIDEVIGRYSESISIIMKTETELSDIDTMIAFNKTLNAKDSFLSEEFETLKVRKALLQGRLKVADTVRETCEAYFMTSDKHQKGVRTYGKIDGKFITGPMWTDKADNSHVPCGRNICTGVCEHCVKSSTESISLEVDELVSS